MVRSLSGSIQLRQVTFTATTADYKQILSEHNRANKLLKISANTNSFPEFLMGLIKTWLWGEIVGLCTHPFSGEANARLTCGSAAILWMFSDDTLSTFSCVRNASAGKSDAPRLGGSLYVVSSTRIVQKYIFVDIQPSGLSAIKDVGAHITPVHFSDREPG